jgi:rhodanese-related sulfurtransferase
MILATFSFIALIAAAAGAENTTSERITPAKAKELLAANQSAILLDVRTKDEFTTGHIEGAILLPYDEITATMALKTIPSKDTTVVVYCRSGRRSAIAAAALVQLGYAKVFDLGGINEWPYQIVK